MISNHNGLSARLKIALNQLDLLHGGIQAITLEVEKQADSRSEFSRFSEKLGVSASSPIDLRVPVKAKKYLGNGGDSKRPESTKAKKFLEVVESPDLLEPNMGETLPQFIGRVMKSHGHATCADIEKCTNGGIESRVAKGALAGVIPNKRTHEKWSRYLGITRNVLDELITITKGQNAN
jgi:hypothetical protein